MSSTKFSLSLSLALGLLLVPVGAIAEDSAAVSQPARAEAAAEAAAPAEAAAGVQAGLATVALALPQASDTAGASSEVTLVADEELALTRGREQLVIANQSMLAVTSGNVIKGDYSAGDVDISDNALSNFNGFGNILINTGAQVSLQTGMNVTLNLGQ
jgi:hypothetical protein